MPHSPNVRVIKAYQGKRVTDIRIERASGRQRRVDQELVSLGYTTPNTPTVERHNGTAHESSQVRKNIGSARLPHVRQTLSDPVNGVYNFCRVNRSLQISVDQPARRRQYVNQTPAVGITDTVRGVLCLLGTVVLSTPCQS